MRSTASASLRRCLTQEGAPLAWVGGCPCNSRPLRTVRVTCHNMVSSRRRLVILGRPEQAVAKATRGGATHGVALFLYLQQDRARPFMVYHPCMPITGPSCPVCRHTGASTRLVMERAYVRRGGDSGDRRWVVIGWYCRQCGFLAQPQLDTLNAARDLQT